MNRMSAVIGLMALTETNGNLVGQCLVNISGLGRVSQLSPSNPSNFFGVELHAA